jgi:class 3 adenylate cyclase
VTSVTPAGGSARLGREEVTVADATRRDEMRPITALFADIVGSTGLGERLGPDEVKALVGEFVTRMSRAVEEYGGIVQAYMGDGICAYFGVPIAHEDDPERAARAGLRIVGVASGYAAEVESAWGITGFSVRVGLNSGPVGTRCRCWTSPAARASCTKRRRKTSSWSSSGRRTFSATTRPSGSRTARKTIPIPASPSGASNR